jgi:hypothetical protein
VNSVVLDARKYNPSCGQSNAIVYLIVLVRTFSFMYGVCLLYRTLRLIMAPRFAGGTPHPLVYDRVIRCLGWKHNTAIYEQNTTPTMQYTGKFPVMCGARFRQKFTLDDAIRSHACSLEANTREIKWHFFWASTPLTGWHCKLRPNTEGPLNMSL